MVSNYPPGSENDPNAPWNQKDSVMVDCDECDGTGLLEHDCGEDVCCCSNPEPNVDCPHCEGEGQIESDEEEFPW